VPGRQAKMIVTDLFRRAEHANATGARLEPVINFNYVGTEKHFENCLYIVNTSGH
jgi:hypothetical protein